MNEFMINPRRLLLLFKRDLKEGLKSSLVIAGSVFGVLFFLIFLGNFGRGGIDHNQTYLSFLFAGGFIFTSGCFREIHLREKNTAYLMLPASGFEKLLERLIASTLVWIAFSLAVYLVCSYTAVFLNNYLLGMHQPYFNPVSIELLRNFPVYIINSSIFFLGAVTFRKMNFFKTLISIFAFFITMAVITAILARFIFIREFNTFFQYHSDMQFSSINLSVMNTDFRETFSVLSAIINVIYYFLTAPFFWFVSYLKLKEIEVRDGI